jgi:hypothetical protein
MMETLFNYADEQANSKGHKSRLQAIVLTLGEEGGIIATREPKLKLVDFSAEVVE